MINSLRPHMYIKSSNPLIYYFLSEQCSLFANEFAVNLLLGCPDCWRMQYRRGIREDFEHAFIVHSLKASLESKIKYKSFINVDI